MMKMQLVPPSTLLLLAIITSTGCTWVEPIAGASSVTLVQPTHVSHCKSLGTTTSQVKANIGMINRNEEKVAGELLTLAKNSAVEVNGDTLVAETPPSGGTQRFRIYKCR